MKNVFIAALLLCFVFQAYAECAANQYSFTFTKRFAASPSEETWQILDVSGPTNITIQDFPNASSSTAVVTNEVCLELKPYLIVLKDSYGDGWGSSQTAAYVYVYYKGSYIFDFTMPFRTGRTYYYDELVFTPSLQFFANSWKYTNSAQTSKSWTTSSFDDSQWTVATGSLPNFSSITRYYRNTYNYFSEPTIRSITLNIVTDAAIVIYVNGIQVYNYKISSTGITATTPATSVKDTTPSSKTITVYGSRFTTGANIIAVEIHQSASETTNTDSFESFLSVRTVANDEVSGNIAVDGIVSGTAPYTSSYALAKAFDRSTSYYYYTTTLPATIIYTYPNGKRDIMNHYAVITGSTTSYGYPKTWSVYASNNGVDWTFLDRQQDVVFGTTNKKLEYPIHSNLIAFNQYKIVFDEGTTANKLCVGDIDFYQHGSTINTLTLSYPQSVFAFRIGDPVISVYPTLGFTEFSSSPALPEGVTLNVIDGYLVVDPVNGVTGSYTITAISVIDGLSQTFSIQLNVTPCSQPSYQPVRFYKFNKSSATQEQFVLRNSMNETIYESPVGIVNTEQYLSMCLPTGPLTLELLDSGNNAWTSQSTLSLQVKVGTEYITYSRFALYAKSYASFTFDLSSPIPYNSYDFKMLQGSMPQNWFQTTFSDATWTTLGETAISSTSNIWLFRKIISVNALSAAHGFQLDLFVKDAFIIYLNGNEFYRYNLPEGPIDVNTKPINAKDTATWFSVTGLLSSLILNTPNTVAIAVINNDNTISNVNFNAHMMYLSSSSTSSRTFGMVATSSATTAALTTLIDMSYSSYSLITVGSTDELSIYFSFENNRAEAFNKYCIVSSSYSDTYDPNDWGMYVSNNGEDYILVANETNVRFDSRKQSKCFYLTSLTKPYTHYKLVISEPWKVSVNYRYYISQVEFLIEDVSKLVIPELYMTPSYVEAFIGSEFPTMIESHDVYRDYTITPSLPQGLELDTTTGNIRGIYVGDVFNTTYTLTAKDHFNTVHTTTIRVAATSCSDTNILVSFYFFGTDTGNEMSFSFSDSNWNTIDSRDYLTKSSSIWFHYCVPLGVYNTYYYDSANNGWQGGYFKVFIDNSYMISKGTVASGQHYYQESLNLAYLIKPSTHIWKYSNQDAEVLSNWHNSDSAVSSWGTSKTPNLPQSFGITQYYATSIYVSPETVGTYSAIDIDVKVRCGAIIYINGNEIRRIRLPADDIAKDTVALSGTALAEVVSTSLSGQFGPINSGINHVGIEVHKCSFSDETSPFDASLRFVTGEMNRVKDGDYTIVGDIMSEASYFPAKYLFDDNYMTYHLSGPRCVGATYGVMYNNEKVVNVNSYHLTTYTNCNPRYPSGWQVQGTLDGNTWVTLDTRSGVYYNYKPQTEYYEFVNKESYRGYRFVVTECNNSPLDYSEQYMCQDHYEFYGNYDDYGFELADFIFTSKLISGICQRQDGYTAATSNTYAYKPCPAYYTGSLRRKCTSGKLGDVEDTCTPGKPEFVNYANKLMVWKVGQKITPLVPTIGAVDYLCEVFPPLPSGLVFDPVNGTISGTPTQAKAAYSYYVTCKNSVDEVSTELILGVNEAKSLPITEYVIFGILIVICIIILIFVSIRLKTTKARKSKLQSTKSSKTRKSSVTESKPELNKTSATSEKKNVAV